ncbi:MAG TPA: polymer-forming cytoskeletal protein [Burkholderiales bacterium]|nr:polymer-forming cytoskeletal protein [Burkholderiales bacterium]
MTETAIFACGCRAACLLAAVCVLWAPPSRGSDDRANVYAAGAEVRIETPVNGDLYAAAGRVSVLQNVQGDAVVAGGSVDLASAIRDDLRAAGGYVTLGGSIAGEAVVVGGSIAFGRDAEVHGRAWLAGGDVAVAGRLLGGLKIYGGHVVILGEIQGPVEIHAEQIEIVGSARIAGDIRYSSKREIRIDPRAQIAGSVARSEVLPDIPRPKISLPGLPPLRPLLLLGLLAAGALLLALFPRFTAHAVQALGASPLRSMGLGTAVFFSLPPVILLLAITIIGIPIALVLAAVYGAAMLVGYLVAACFIGERLLHAMQRRQQPTSYGWRIATLAVALLLLRLAYGIPYAGTFLFLIALIAGLGAMVLQAFSSYATKH